MARPKKYEVSNSVRNNDVVVFTLRIDKDIYSRLCAEACVNRRSINAQILVMLEYQINLVDKQLSKINNK